MLLNIDDSLILYGLDISNPEEPVAIEYPDDLQLEGTSGDLYLEGGYAWVTHGSNLSMVDVDPPEEAHVLDQWSLRESRRLRHPLVVNNHVLVRGWYPVVLLSLELDENLGMNFADSLSMPTGVGYGGYFQNGDILYQALQNGGLMAVDLTDPSNLNESYLWDPVKRFYRAGILDGRLLTSNEQDGVGIYDLSMDNSLPHLSDLLPEGEESGALRVFGEDYAIVSWSHWSPDDGGWFELDEISYQVATINPDNPDQLELRGQIGSDNIRFMETNGDITYGIEVDIRDDSTYLSLVVFDINDPDNPELEGSTIIQGHVNAFHYQDDHLYLEKADIFGFGLIEVFDVSIPTEPGSIGEMDIQFDWNRELIFRDNRMIVSQGFAERVITVHDLDDPLNPELVMEFVHDGGGVGLLDYKDG